jgi:low affinity Fe/Cu permease
VATGYQYRHDDRYFSDGVLDSASTEQDAVAIHLKLNEIVAALEGASNRLIDVEDLSEAEIAALRKYYRKLIQLAKEDDNLTTTHSIEEATSSHGRKYKKKAK